MSEGHGIMCAKSKESRMEIQSMETVFCLRCFEDTFCERAPRAKKAPRSKVFERLTFRDKGRASKM